MTAREEASRLLELARMDLTALRARLRRAARRGPHRLARRLRQRRRRAVRQPVQGVDKGFHMTSINPRLLIKLQDALARLSEVMPRKARYMLLESEHIMKDFGLEAEIIPDEWGTLRVTPSGIKIILELYYNEDLPLKKKAKPSMASELEDYAKSESSLFDRSRAIEMENKARQERRASLIADPSLAREEELIYPLLNEIFWEHGLRGDAELEIGGFQVQKLVIPYRSNSGKSKEYSVHFSWKGSDGRVHEAIKKSCYSDNRRNDSNRNYGLPE